MLSEDASRENTMSVGIRKQNASRVQEFRGDVLCFRYYFKCSGVCHIYRVIRTSCLLHFKDTVHGMWGRRCAKHRCYERRVILSRCS